MSPAGLLRTIVPPALALAVAWAVDRRGERQGLTPPGFRTPWRRALAGLVVAAVIWAGVTAPLGHVGRAMPQPDLSTLSTPELFLLHGLLLAAILVWFLLGFAGVRTPLPVPPPLPAPDLPAELAEPAPGPPAAPAAAIPPAVYPYAAPAAPPRPAAPPPAAAGGGSLAHQLAVQFGFVAPSVPREIGLGLLLGAGAWVVVLVGIFAFALALYALGGENALPKEPPALVPWIAALPIGVRVLVSLSAGVVEEWFFRGFLQPRVGIALSTSCFVLAHFSYGQPFMLVGIAMLSLIYAFLVRWRQTLWPAIAAHALFDGVQLLVVIPWALKLMGAHGAKAAALLGFC